MGSGAGVADIREQQFLLESAVKVTEKGERPLELTGSEELLTSLGLREEEEEMEALLEGESRVRSLDL